MAVKKIKVKTHSGAKKRFKKLKNGGIVCAHPGRRKFLTKKSSRRKRSLAVEIGLKLCDIGHISPILPYVR